MRVVALVALAACASSPKREERPFGESNYHPCGGADRLEVEVTVDHAVAPGPAGSAAGSDGGERGAIEVISSCCRGNLLVDGELRLFFYEYRPEKLDVPIGKHRISVEIDGHRRWERDVAIAAGDRLFLKLRL